MSKDELVERLRQVLLLRVAEETVGQLFSSGEIAGTAHLGIGQEGVPVGFCRNLTPADLVTMTYRGHGWALAKGIALGGFFGELMGREQGVCRGRGGSMHMADMDVGLLGATGIVGGGLPIAVGAALAAQQLADGRVAVAVFGDGATNIGTFHESLNLAAVWRLPVVFVCENNLYGEFTPARETCLLADLSDRAAAYGMPGESVDGNDVAAVEAAAQRAIARARDGGGPTLVEAKTYRHRGHSRNDPARYRPAGELEEWMARDPIVVLRDRLASTESDDGINPDDLVERLRAEVQDEVDVAVEVARQMAWPVESELLSHVYAGSS